MNLNKTWIDIVISCKSIERKNWHWTSDSGFVTSDLEYIFLIFFSTEQNRLFGQHFLKNISTFLELDLRPEIVTDLTLFSFAVLLNVWFALAFNS